MTTETEKELKEEIERIKIKGCGNFGCPYTKENNNQIYGRDIVCDDCISEMIKLRFQLKNLQERNAEVKQIIQEWYNDEKTCSGKPHCLIEDCDLCVVCFDELLEKLGLGK